MTDLEYHCFMIRQHAEKINNEDLRAVIAGHQGIISRPEMDLEGAERQIATALETIRAILQQREGIRHELARAA